MHATSLRVQGHGSADMMGKIGVRWGGYEITQRGGGDEQR